MEKDGQVHGEEEGTRRDETDKIRRCKRAEGSQNEGVKENQNRQKKHCPEPVKGLLKIAWSCEQSPPFLIKPNWSDKERIGVIVHFASLIVILPAVHAFKEAPVVCVLP